MSGVIHSPSLQSPVPAVLVVSGMQNLLPWSGPAYHPAHSHGTVLGRFGGVVYGPRCRRTDAGIAGGWLGLVHGIGLFLECSEIGACHDQINPYVRIANVDGAGGSNQDIRPSAPGDGLSRPAVRSTTSSPGQRRWAGGRSGERIPRMLMVTARMPFPNLERIEM